MPFCSINSQAERFVMFSFRSLHLLDSCRIPAKLSPNTEVLHWTPIFHKLILTFFISIIMDLLKQFLTKLDTALITQLNLGIRDSLLTIPSLPLKRTILLSMGDHKHSFSRWSVSSLQIKGEWGQGNSNLHNS